MQREIMVLQEDVSVGDMRNGYETQQRKKKNGIMSQQCAGSSITKSDAGGGGYKETKTIDENEKKCL